MIFCICWSLHWFEATQHTHELNPVFASLGCCQLRTSILPVTADEIRAVRRSFNNSICFIQSLTSLSKTRSLAERKSAICFCSSKLENGTALIAFSRAEVLKLKQKLQKKYSVSVIYGNLSPEVRRDEARRFRDGQSQILIATDAISMGLNLPIKTILFTTDTKFDGISKRKISVK